MIAEFLESLSDIHSELEVVWPDGRESSCCSNDGRHYALKGFPRPVSVGQVEAHLLYNLAVSAGVSRAFEIGTGFGYSSFWIGAAIKRNAPFNGWLGSLDNHSEGSAGPIALDFAASGAKRLGLDRTVDYIVGSSPSDVDKHVSAPVTLAFIDGAHGSGQPRLDYLAIRRRLSDTAFLVWHDVQSRYDVWDGIAEAIRDGWSPVVFPTSCRLCVCYKSAKQWDLALDAFTAARALSLL
jgi:predicted O-methyltransferase YrrM